jgi:hypothetical protein
VMPDGKPFIHMQSYTGSISENARLRPLLESWRGKPFTALEGKGFKLYKLLGAPCCLVIKHSFDRVSNQLWAHIIAISKLPSGVECPPPVNSPIYFDLDHYSEAAYLSVPEGIRKKINLEGVTALTQAADQEIGGEVASPASLEAEETVENFPF